MQLYWALILSGSGNLGMKSFPHCILEFVQIKVPNVEGTHKRSIENFPPPTTAKSVTLIQLPSFHTNNCTLLTKRGLGPGIFFPSWNLITPMAELLLAFDGVSSINA